MRETLQKPRPVDPPEKEVPVPQTCEHLETGHLG